MGLRCAANPVSVATKEELVRLTAEEARRQRFEGSARPGKSLPPARLKERAARICKETGSCARDLSAYAELVTTRLNPPPRLFWKTQKSVTGLFRSAEIKDDEIVKLVRTMMGTGNFATVAQELFSKYGRFLWVLFPKGSVGICFAEEEAKTTIPQPEKPR